MKMPVDPSEPLFPERPNEPVCQYYVKHGTCKFGQACKFNHPPQAPLQTVMNGGTVLMNVGRKSDSPQLVLSPVGPVDSNGGSMMLQFLPQRPEEPDCIFFLKNGCCKYGATCRYHHPINYHQRRVDDTRRHRGPNQEQPHTQKMQHIHHAGPPAGFNQGNIVLTDGPTTFINLDGSPAQQGYQVIASNDVSSYGVPLGTGIVTEQGSAASSIASSYETAGSGLEHGDFTSALWNRARKNGSGNSLGAYTADSSGHSGHSGHGRPQGTRAVLRQSGSDGNISRHRDASNGSASDNSIYYDAAPPGMSRSTSGQWRHERPIPYDHSRRIPMNQYGPRGDGTPSNGGVVAPEHRGGDQKSPPSRGRPPVVGPRQRRRSPKSGEHDEGFTMMTSALLNMLDTPEEAAEHYIFQDPYQREDLYAYSEEIDPHMFEGLSLNPSRREPGNLSLNSPRRDPGNYHAANANDPSSWPPGWQPTPTLQDNRPRVLQSRHGPATNSPNDSDVGLYLP
jgi:hypothetical protein